MNEHHSDDIYSAFPINRSNKIHFHREFTPILVAFLPINGKRIVRTIQCDQSLNGPTAMRAGKRPFKSVFTLHSFIEFVPQFH
eukprot:COSAG06_NODE_6334_length_2979_cov_6.013194_2_plen_83_part_00